LIAARRHADRLDGRVRVVQRGVGDDLAAHLEAAAGGGDDRLRDVLAAGLLTTRVRPPEARRPADLDATPRDRREDAARGRIARVGRARVVVVAGDRREDAARGGVAGVGRARAVVIARNRREDARRLDGRGVRVARIRRARAVVVADRTLEEG